MTILYTKVSSKSAKLLAEELGCEAIKDLAENEDSNAESLRDSDYIIRWGASYLLRYLPHGKVLNKASAIKNAVNKFESNKIFEANGIPTPKITFDVTEAEGFGFPLIARKMHHHGGKGFIIVDDKETLTMMNYNVYFAEMINKAKEYRIWVLGGIPFLAHRRYNDSGEIAWNGEGESLEKVEITNIPYNVLKYSVKAVESLKLDFGAVDIATDDEGNPFVFEVNTAPQLTRYRAEKLAEAIRDWLEI